MRYYGLLLLTGLSAMLPLGAQAQEAQPQEMAQAMPQDAPQAVPAGMQAVPAGMQGMPQNVQAIPAGDQPMVANQQPAMGPAQVQQQVPMMQQQAAPAAQPVPMPVNDGKPACENTMQLHISHGITYMTGGISQAEIEQLKSLDGEFNLQLLFAAKSGDHLVNHSVRILDFHNFELVAAQASGPYLYANMHPGDYYVEVINEPGMAPVKTKIKVPSKGRVRKTILLK